MKRLTFIRVTDPEDGDLWQLQQALQLGIIWQIREISTPASMKQQTQVE